VKWGWSKAPSPHCGQPHILLFEDMDYILALVNHHPDWFLDELLGLLEHNCFISVHFATICQELIRAGISFKKLRKIAK